MKIIDAHSHIDCITHLNQPEVVGTIVCATNESDWDFLSKTVMDDNCVYGAFGVHPWFVDSISFDFESRLKFLLKNNSRYMVGEIGLDKYKSNMEKQMDVFQKQFDIGVKLKRNMFVHCVGAWDKILYVLKQYKKTELPNIVFHAFNGSDDVIKNLLNNYSNNIFFSFNKNALYARNIRIKQIDANKILVESDGNPDVSLIDIVTKISEIKNNSNISTIIYDNTQKVLTNG